MNPGNAAWIGLLVAAALASLLLVRQEPEAPVVADPGRPGVGYYVDDAYLTVTGEDGRIIYRLRAATGGQNLDDGSITLDDVELRYDAALEVPWHVRADRGTVPADGRIITLSGDVVALTGNGPEPPTTIRTDYLELDPEAYLASTRHAVAIERPDGTITARGMRFHLREDRLELLEDVRGRTTPAPRD